MHKILIGSSNFCSSGHDTALQYSVGDMQHFGWMDVWMGVFIVLSPTALVWSALLQYPSSWFTIRFVGLCMMDTLYPSIILFLSDRLGWGCFFSRSSSGQQQANEESKENFLILLLPLQRILMKSTMAICFWGAFICQLPCTEQRFTCVCKQLTPPLTLK